MCGWSPLLLLLHDSGALPGVPAGVLLPGALPCVLLAFAACFNLDLCAPPLRYLVAFAGSKFDANAIRIVRLTDGLRDMVGAWGGGGGRRAASG